MKIFDAISKNKILVLGTALWGWGIEKKVAFQLLDGFIEFGGIFVDTAINYPINKNKDDLGLALKWITDWIKSRRKTGLSVMLKIGAIDNSGGSISDLSSENIKKYEIIYRDVLGDALGAILIHWDNRGEYEKEKIEETILSMEMIERSGISIGFSGVKSPEIYLRSSSYLSDKWLIQVKENIISNNSRLKYSKYFPNSKYFAYGINMGGYKNEKPANNSSVVLRGIKYDSEIVYKLSKIIESDNGFHPTPKNINELLLLCSYCNPKLSGIIIGPRNIKQLYDTLYYWQKIKDEQCSIISPLNSFLFKD
jgi:hypothetical protein